MWIVQCSIWANMGEQASALVEAASEVKTDMKKVSTYLARQDQESLAVELPAHLPGFVYLRDLSV